MLDFLKNNENTNFKLVDNEKQKGAGNARNAALRRVAVAAATKGEQRLALRAAGRIRDVASRARVYGEIAEERSWK